ncbi:60S ribosomal protein L5 [Lunasporangiospora selenospora]|uniref:60S ribosomal protein L5 n=1 Tax=Lunasporangiospora selenospora TaxID=979761 RepID=A0A9P6FQC0_9FUNG|nr:60S ribosomal protein L5 [Lunasporangiospora selenospora]
MPFVKLVKNKAYYKRFQVKYRRRREGKTDYYARKRLVVQAKNKYNSPKYRLVVRFTNSDIVCQIVYAKLQGDFVLAAAYAHELPKYGVKGGLTNWAAAYCTGLLVARRVLTKLGLADKYEGVTEPDGTIAMTEAAEDAPRPFKCFLDEEDDEKYKKQFSKFLAAGVEPDDVEEMYQEAHNAIRENPAHVATEKKKPAAGQKTTHRKQALNYKQRKNKVQQKLKAFNAKNGISA